MTVQDYTESVYWSVHTHLLTALFIGQLIVTGVEGLVSIHRLQNHFVSHHNL